VSPGVSIFTTCLGALGNVDFTRLCHQFFPKGAEVVLERNDIINEDGIIYDLTKTKILEVTPSHKIKHFKASPILEEMAFVLSY
jgi:hypothetical protein